MSLRRYDAKRDTSEPAILDALRQVGADYLLLDPFDVLVLYRQRLTMLEVKSLTGTKAPKMRKKTASQINLQQRGWPIHFVATAAQALAAIGAGT